MIQIITKSQVITALAVLLFSLPVNAVTKEQQKVEPPKAAPTFTIKDVAGSTINLADYKGKKVLLCFYRNVGCPVCNLRFHELEGQAAYFKSKDLIVLSVYESSAVNMKHYVGNEYYYSVMLPNPDQSLYQLYDIDRSMGKVMKGMFHGAMGKMKAGKKLFKKKMKQDGNKDRIGADFLIDENGNVLIAHYGKYIGDNLPVSEIKKFLH